MRFGVRGSITSPEVMCAVLLCEVWLKMHGKLPYKDNDRAQAGCAGLWTAAGGEKASPKGNGRWRYWIEQAVSIIAGDAPASVAKSWAGVIRAILRTANLKKPSENNAGFLPSDASHASRMVVDTKRSNDHE